MNQSRETLGRNRKRVYRIAALCLSLSLSLAAGAQTGLAQMPDRANREEFQKMMEAYVLSKLQDSLELSDEQYAQMVVAQKKLQDSRRELRRERQGLLRRLRQSLNRARPDDDLESLLSELADLTERQFEEQRVRQTAIDEILDTRQRARYRLLEVELERRLQQLMREVRQRRQPRR